ncbi:hypothetical protein [Phocaeicola sp.]
MKKRSLFNILFGSLVFAGTILSSCAKDDDLAENVTYETRMVSFNVNHDINEISEEARGLSEEPDTIYQQLDNGIQIEAFIKKNSANSRVTSSGSVKVDPGTKVLAIVVNVVTLKVHSIQNISVDSDYKLTCSLPNVKSRVIFYSYYRSDIRPTTNIVVGDSFTAITTSKSNLEYPGTDMMWCQTQDIGPDDNTLGKVNFLHLATSINVAMYDETDDSSLRSFKTVLSNCACTAANVFLAGGAIVPNENLVDVSLDSDYRPNEGTQYSPITYILPSRVATPIKLKIASINDTPINKTLTFTKNLLSGFGYTIYVHVKSKLIEGPTGFYQWDAQSAWKAGTVPAAGSNSYYNNTGGDWVIASNSCKDCPTYINIQQMLADGVYWDDNGPEWTDLENKKHTTGLWVVKKKSILGNHGSGTTSVTPKTATDTQRKSSNYMFLPAAGNLDGSGKHQNSGTDGYYWTNESAWGSLTNASYLRFNKSTARATYVSRSTSACLWHIDE